MEEFISTIGEDRHHHFADVYDPQLSVKLLNELNSVFSRNDIAYPAARMVLNGSAVPLEEYYRFSSGDAQCLLLNNSRAFDLLVSGYTLVVQCAHCNMPTIRKFSSELESELGCALDLSIFVTPPFSVGLKAHYDTSSAFIFQIYGQKRWRLFKPYHALPLSNSTFTYSDYKETPPTADVALRAGERLYIPRGVVHAPESEGELSVHLTISLDLQTYTDEVKGILAQTKEIGAIATEAMLSEALDALGLPPGKTGR